MKNSVCILFICGFLFFSCSEKKEPLGINAHPGEWLKNHGKVIVQDSSLTLRSCQTCHGVNYDGGSSNISCISCHNYPHVDSWVQKSSEQFHGVIALEVGDNQCQSCHGQNYEGGSSGVSCYDCHNYPHLETWLSASSSEFHGKVVVDSGKEQCQSCHGNDYSGGRAGVSCLSCHSYPHLEGWIDQNNAQFHGIIAKQSENENCQSCHGEKFDGGTSNVSCFDCHTYPHLDPWLQKESPEFHGQIMLTVGKLACQSCHGADYTGGSSEVSCFTCHKYPHQDGFASPGTDNFHENYLREEVLWNISSCKTCHGGDYSGGRAGYSCLTCHLSANGPEACNTCHGSSENFAPPLDLNNNNDESAVGVGAHQEHVDEPEVTNALDCSVCHIPVANFDDPNHIDETPHAEIVFDARSTQNGTLASSWVRNNTTCSEIYCHGGFVFKKSESANDYAYADSLITGNKNPVNWVQSSEAEKCGFCHGIPPTGHIDFGWTVQNCAACHSAVVDAQGNIIDKSKHINGQADLN